MNPFPFPHTPFVLNPPTPPVTEQPNVKPPQLIQVQTQQYLTQSQFINRKSLNGAILPLYVKIGKAECDSCKIKELIHGYHCDPNTDICIRCFSFGNSFLNSLSNSWIEFNAE